MDSQKSTSTTTPYNYQQINSTLDEIHDLFEQNHGIDPKHNHTPDGGYCTSLLLKVVFRRPTQTQEMFNVIRRSLSNSHSIDYVDVINAYNAESDEVYETIPSNGGGLVTYSEEFKNRLLGDVLAVGINTLYPATIVRQTKIYSDEYDSPYHNGFSRDYRIFDDYSTIYNFMEFERNYRGLEPRNYSLLKAIVDGFFGYYIHRMPLPEQLHCHTIVTEARKLVKRLATQFEHVIAIEVDVIYCWDSSGEGFDRCLDIIKSEYKNISIDKMGIIPYALWLGKKKKLFMKEMPITYGFGGRALTINGKEKIYRDENGNRIPFSNTPPPLSEWLRD